MVFINTFMPQLKNSDESALITSIKYNLKQLLENEAPLLLLEPELKQCQSSILAFGIEDIQSLNYQLGKNIFTTRIKQLIEHFEHRIENVDVSVLANNEQQNAISFIVSGELLNGQEFQLNSQLNISDFSVSMENEIV